MSRHVPHLNVRVFTVLVFVSLPLMAVAAALVLGVGQAQLRDSYGLQLTQVAEHIAAGIDTYMYRRILDVGVLAKVPGIHDVAAASTAPLDPDKVRAIEKEWDSARVATAQRLGVLDSPVAAYLRDITEHDRIYREIFVTDRAGRLVATSNVTTDYYQADEAWWQEAFDDGVRGRVSVGDVGWDESAKAFVIEIGMPITLSADSQFVGILKVMADAREMLAPATGLQLGTTGEAWILRTDGSVVYSRRASSPKLQFFAVDLLRPRLEAYKAGTLQLPLTLRAGDSDGRGHVVAVVASQLGLSYSKLDWIVAMTQAEDEVFAPVRAQFWRLIGVFGLVAALVMAVTAWFSVRLSQPPIEPGLHLSEHPAVARIEDTD
ncbi:MAG: cache domain-containing protein [Vicinamibacterales bacterium]|nr:cache domain-containing protein [Vicinamibacterales bacterium]